MVRNSNLILPLLPLFFLLFLLNNLVTFVYFFLLCFPLFYYPCLYLYPFLYLFPSLFLQPDFFLLLLPCHIRLLIYYLHLFFGSYIHLIPSPGFSSNHLLCQYSQNCTNRILLRHSILCYNIASFFYTLLIFSKFLSFYF